MEVLFVPPCESPIQLLLFLWKNIMTNLTILNNNKNTMSSLEIAELTGKRHDHVVRDIKKILEQATIEASQFWEAREMPSGQTSTVYHLPKFECDLVVSGYSVKYRSAIIKRWHELESRSNNLSLEDMTLLVIEGQKNKIAALELKIETDKPVTEFGMAISQSAGTCKVGDWIKALNDSGDLKIGRNRAFALLRKKGYLMKDNMPMQSKIDQGLFSVKEGMVVTDKRTIQTFTTLLTGKGQMVLAGKLRGWLK